MTNENQQTDEIGNPAIELQCPECGESESFSMGPTFSISFDIEVAVNALHCSECGYDGPPADSAPKRRTNDSLYREIENL